MLTIQTNNMTSKITYKVVRFYRDSDHPDHLKVIKTGLTLEEAREHCNDEDTHEVGVWFDGYEEE